MEYRIERDSMGEVRVPADRYWGAQTQRSHENFPIGVGIETMPAEIIRAFAVLKKAAGLELNYVCPLHGFVWRSHFGDFLDKYLRWSSYTPEEDGVLLAYAREHSTSFFYALMH